MASGFGASATTEAGVASSAAYTAATTKSVRPPGPATTSTRSASPSGQRMVTNFDTPHCVHSGDLFVYTPRRCHDGRERAIDTRTGGPRRNPRGRPATMKGTFTRPQGHPNPQIRPVIGHLTCENGINGAFGLVVARGCWFRRVVGRSSERGGWCSRRSVEELSGVPLSSLGMALGGSAGLPVACNSAVLARQVEGCPDMSAFRSNSGLCEQGGQQQARSGGLPLRSASWFASVTSGGLRGFPLRL